MAVAVLEFEESIVGYIDSTFDVGHFCVIEESEDKGSNSCAVLKMNEFLSLKLDRAARVSIAVGGSNLILHPSISASKTSRYA